MDSPIAKAFAAFEGQRLAELLSQGADTEEAQLLVLQEWEAMDDAARSEWVSEGIIELDSVSTDPLRSKPGGAPTPSRARAKRPATEPPSAATASKARKVGKAVAASAPKSAAAALHPASEWIYPALILESQTPDAGPEFEDEDESAQKPDEAERRQHAFRTSHVIQVGGTHPDWLTEPAAVAEISLPKLTAEELVRIPRFVAEEGRLSSPQMESVAYAARRFRSYLPSGTRAGYYLGDGTGCGKGRIIAALVWCPAQLIT